MRALDIGTGIGNTLEILEHNATQVIAIDRNLALLNIAQQRADNNTTLLQADMTELPFDDGSFDLVTSLGVEGNLDKPTATGFYSELARVMMPGATYASAFYNFPYLPSQEMSQVTETSKAMLADMICDTVSGGAVIRERLNGDQISALLGQLSLREEYYVEISEDEKTHVLIRVITKDSF